MKAVIKPQYVDSIPKAIKGKVLYKKLSRLEIS